MKSKKFFTTCMPGVMSLARLAPDYLLQTNPCEGPVAVRRAQRNLQHLRNLGQRQPDKIAELDHFCRCGVFSRELVERVVDPEDLLSGRTCRDFQFGFIKGLELDLAAAFEAGLASGALYENAAHCLPGRSEEMRTVLPARLLISPKSQPGLMHQRSGLKRLARHFMRHLRGGNAAQFVINQREQCLSGLGITVLNAVEDASHVAHDIRLAS